jgi:hypothetical protein
MNCPVCDGVLSYSGIPDLFDCKTCEVRWVQETDADSGFTYFDASTVNKQRWIIRPSRWDAVEELWWATKSSDTVITTERWKRVDFVVEFETEGKDKMGPMKKLLEDCVRIDETTWKFEIDSETHFQWFFEEEYGLPTLENYTTDGGDLEIGRFPYDILDELGYQIIDTNWIVNGDVYIIADNVPLENYRGFESESKGSGLTRKDLVLLSAGAVIGVFSGVIGEVLAELVLDRIRKTPELETTETAE